MFKRTLHLCFLISAFCFSAVAQSVIQTTPYTRSLLKSTNAAAARLSLAELTGLVGDGITDNSVALSNLFNTQRIGNIPAGTYSFTNPIICNSQFFIGGEVGTVLSYKGSSNVFAIQMRQGSSELSGITLNCNQWWNYGSYTGTIATAGGGIYVNASGSARVDDVFVHSAHGKAFYVHGSVNIFARSNALQMTSCRASNVYDGLWLAQSNYSEYITVTDFRADRVQNIGTFVGGANVIINGIMLKGYVDTPNGEVGGNSDGIATGTGLWIESAQSPSASPFRLHSEIGNAHVGHFLRALVVQNGGGPVSISDSFFGGSGSVLFSNLTQISLDNVTMELWGENKMAAVNAMTAVNCRFINGTMSGWFPWGYVGVGNTRDGVPMAIGGFADVILKENLSWFNAKLGTPGNTVTPVNYIAITNNGARYFIPAFQ